MHPFQEDFKRNRKTHRVVLLFDHPPSIWLSLNAGLSQTSEHVQKSGLENRHRTLAQLAPSVRSTKAQIKGRS